jgi:hypothetical protein
MKTIKLLGLKVRDISEFLEQTMEKVSPSEITPEHIYLSRRDFLKSMGFAAASTLVLAACGSKPSEAVSETEVSGTLDVSTSTDELGNALTPL